MVEKSGCDAIKTMLVLVVMIKMMRFHLFQPDNVCFWSQVTHVVDEIVADDSHHDASQHHRDLYILKDEVRRDHQEKYQWVNCAHSDR